MMVEVHSGLEFIWDKRTETLNLQKRQHEDLYEDQARKAQFYRKARQMGFPKGKLFIFDVQIPSTLPYLKTLLELCENEGMSKEAQDSLALLCHQKWKL